jgi:REP element-mobilizing transposase RayT
VEHYFDKRPTCRYESCHALPEIVRALKSFSARRVNRMRRCEGNPVWQRNYYEHIIRNDREWDAIRQYIIDNPLNWEQDRENPWDAGMPPAPGG